MGSCCPSLTDSLLLKCSCRKWGLPWCGEITSQIVWIYSDTTSGWKWVIPFLIHLTISVTWSSMKLFAVSVVAMERGIFPVVFQLNIITFSNTTTCWESRGKWRERQIITKVSYSLLFVVDNRKCKATWFHSKGNTVCFPEKQRPLAVCAHAYMVKLIQ